MVDQILDLLRIGDELQLYGIMSASKRTWPL